MILITGASGKTGQAIVRILAENGEAIRAMVHQPKQVSLLQALGATEVITGDFNRPADILRAMQGVHRVYHISPNMHPAEFAISQATIEAACAAGVEHFVYHSVLHPQVEEMPHHWQKMLVEQLLFKSNIAFTILQPAAYMQNVLAQWNKITDTGTYQVPYAVKTRLGMVDLQEVARVAAKVLKEKSHAGAIYELAGAEALLQTEVAEILSRQLGKTITAEAISHDEWEKQARSNGLNEYAIDTLKKMFLYYERFGFWGNPSVLTWLLDRKPASFTDFVHRTIQEKSSSQG